MNPRTARRFLAFFMVFGAHVLAPPSEAAMVHGSATYRERMALPPGAVFEATLEDVSRADGAARVIARTRQANPGQVPISFRIRYDGRDVEYGRRYRVRASILERGRMLFTGTQSYLTTQRGRGRTVQVTMRRVPGVPPGEDDGDEGRLGNTRWRAIRIDDRRVILPPRQREPWIHLEPRSNRVTGSGGCNQISGTYESGRAGRLRFGPLITTKMACPSMDLEYDFLRALEDTRRYQVRGRILELFDGRGRSVATLEERNLR